MNYMRYWQERIQTWQDKTWIKFDAVTPYNIRHANQQGKLSCVSDALFNRYCGPYSTDTWTRYKSSKKRKLFWRLHPEQYDRFIAH